MGLTDLERGRSCADGPTGRTAACVGTDLATLPAQREAVVSRTSRRFRRNDRARGDRGASLVEFALVLPILALLIFAIIDFGSAYNDFQSLRNGVRNGARDAVVTNFGSTTSCLSSPTGGTVTNPTTNPAQKIICHVKDATGLGNNVRVGVWAPGGWTPGASLRICAQWQLSSTSGFTSAFLNGKVITSKVEMRIEQDLSATDKPNFAQGQENAWSSWPSNCTTG